MAGKCVENRVNSIRVFLIQTAEHWHVLAIKKGNGVKSDESGNFVDILVDGYRCQVHVVEYECFEKRGVQE